jgi:hypothetical protein
MAATQRECAPPGLCPDGITPREPGYAHCDSVNSARYCVAPGDWTDVPSPQPGAMACDAQGVPSGGVRAPAECEEGMGWLEMTCSTCETFLASSGVCLNACVRDSACFPGFHCAQDGCHPPSNGSPCEVDTECDSGRCEGSCEPRAPDGETCDEASDCAGGTCANGLCCAGGICCNAASSVEDCGAYTCNTTTFTCNDACADGTDASCATGFHCISGNSRCVPNADGNPCDEASDCISGYCNGAGVCAAAFQIGNRNSPASQLGD